MLENEILKAFYSGLHESEEEESFVVLGKQQKIRERNLEKPGIIQSRFSNL
jgi:hypothetical protein